MEDRAIEDRMQRREKYPEHPLMSQTVIVDMDKCTGCRLCELICSLEQFGVCNPQKSYIRVLRNEDMDVNIPAVSVQCDFCGKCVEHCIPGALRIVSWDEAAVVRKRNRLGLCPAPLFGQVPV